MDLVFRLQLMYDFSKKNVPHITFDWTHQIRRLQNWMIWTILEQF